MKATRLFAFAQFCALSLLLGAATARANVTSVTVPANATYKVGDALNFTVNYGENATVNTAGGTPSIGVTLDTGGTVNAAYVSGSGTNALVFRYTVSAGNLDVNGIALAGSIALNGGTITGPVDALTLTSVGATTAVLVDGVAPTVTSVNSSTANGSYKAGDVISVQVNFSESVVVTGTPTLSLNSGGTASYAIGTGTATLNFNYTVGAGDASTDLDYSTINSLTLAGGSTIKDAAGNNATLTLPLVGTGSSLGGQKSLVIDGIAPTVSSINRQSPTGASTNATSVTYRVTFSEVAAGVDTTDFALTATGTATGTIASVSSVSGSVYDVTVNTISSSGTLRLDLKNAGTGIADSAGNAIAAGFTAGQTYTIDSVAPTVANVNSTTANGAFPVGGVISIQVNFSEAVIVTGTPTLTLETGTTDRTVNYASGSGTTALTFSYTVQTGDTSADLDYVGTSSLALNGGAIADAAGNNAVLTLATPATANSLGANKALVIDTAAPTVTSVAVPANGSYKSGANLDFVVTFSKTIVVAGLANDSTLGLTIGGNGRTAAFLSTTATSVTYRYTVQAGETDTDGITVGTLTLNNNTIKDTAGNSAVTTLNSVGATTAVLVDNTGPTVTSVTVPANSRSKAAATLDFTVNFSEPITVGGTNNSTLGLTVGITAKTAVYLSSAASSVTYRYTVAGGDNDTDGIAVGSLTLNANTITDLAGNPAIVTLNNVGSTAGVLVDTTAPTVTSVSVPANGSYNVGSALDFTVNFSEAVTVTGTDSTLGLTVGVTPRSAAYSSKTGTSITYRYVVQTGETDADGVAVGTLTLNTTTIADAAGNLANTTLNGVPSTAAVLVDTSSPPGPTVLSVSVPANGSYKEGANLDFTVTFNAPITVAGTTNSTLGVTIGSTLRQAVFQSGATTATSIKYRWTVLAGETDTDGITVGTITLNGTTITDGATPPKNAVTTLNGVPSTAAVLVDTTAPTLTKISRQSPTTVNTTATSVTFRATFSEAVTGVSTSAFTLTTVSGTPAGTISSVSASTGTTIDIVISGIGGTGTFRLDLISSGTGIADPAGNALVTGGFTSGDIFVIGASNVFDSTALNPGAARTVSFLAGTKVAQRFTTSAAAPLTVTKVSALLTAVTNNPSAVVTINNNNAGQPGAVVATLTNPTTLVANALNTWTTGALLSASTTYWLVFDDTSANGSYAISSTTATTAGVGSWLTTTPDYFFSSFAASAWTGSPGTAGALLAAIGAVGTPVITSSLTASGTYGSAFAGYQITASGSPTSFGASGLPNGLSLDSNTGIISGTPTQFGNVSISLTATNSAGTGAASTLVLSLSRASLTATAENKTRAYGEQNPVFTLTYSGFVGTDTAATALLSELTISTTAAPSSPVGTYAITPSGGLALRYTITNVAGTLTITKATAGIALENLTQVTNGEDRVVTVTTTPANLPVIVTYDGGSTPPILPGTYNVSAVINDASYQGTATGVLTITKGPATVFLANLNQPYTGSPTAAAVITVPGGLAATVTYDGSASAPVNAGSYAVVAVLNDSTYEGTASGTLTITKANATVTLGGLSQTYNGTARTVTATTAPAGQPVAITYNGGTTAPVNAGTYAVAATVSGTNYLASATGTLTVAKGAATITLGSLSQTYTGAARTATATTSPAGLPVSFTYNGSPNAPVNPGTYTVVATCTDSNYEGTATGTLSIVSTSAAIALGNLSQTYSGSARSVTATTTPAGLTVNITYNGSATPPVNAGTYAIAATISDSLYQGSTTGTLVIAKAAQTITFTASGSGIIGQPGALGATATSGLPVTFSVVSGGATISGSTLTITAPGTVVLRAFQAGSDNYLSAGADQTIANVSKLGQTITFAGPGNAAANAPPFALSATASSGLPVSFAINSGPAVLSGNTVTLTSAAGTVTITASQAGNAIYDAAASVTRSFTVAAAGPRVFFGDMVDSTGTRKVGDAAAVLPPAGGSGDLVLVAPQANVNIAFNFTLGADGTFVKVIVDNNGLQSAPDGSDHPVAAAPRTLTLRGRVVDNVLTGRFDEIALSFSTTVQTRGTSTSSAGFYQSSSINSASGATYTVVGNNGEVLVLASTTDVAVGGRTTLNANGTYNFTSAGVSVSGTIDPVATTVTGTLSQTGKPDTVFSGVASTTVRTDRLVNLSSRALIGPADGRTLITGFVIGGTASKRVVLRAIGPTLTAFGVTGTVSNPRLQVYDGAGRLVLENDDWTGTDTSSAFTQVGAFALATGTRDAALVTTLTPGPYTMHVLGGTETGIALAEIYDAGSGALNESQRLVNISTRGLVDTGDGALIGGFAISGNSPKKVLIRGAGPVLALFGVTGVLADPRLTVYSGQTVIAQNDDWGTPVNVGSAQAATAAEIIAAAQATGAFTYPTGTRDAAVVVTLAPGSYTAQVSGVNGQTGAALVEIYEIPQ